MREPTLVDLCNNTTFDSSGGRHSIQCKKGLWGVDSPSAKQSLTEAWHYFVQYWEDGEYEDASN